MCKSIFHPTLFFLGNSKLGMKLRQWKSKENGERKKANKIAISYVSSGCGDEIERNEVTN